MIVTNRAPTTSLQLWHPSLSVQELSELVGCVPEVVKHLGEPRGVIRGQPTKARMRENYISVPFTRGETLEERVEELIETLLPQSDVFGAKMMSGRASFSAYFDAIDGISFALSPARLRQIGEWNIELGVLLCRPG